MCSFGPSSKNQDHPVIRNSIRKTRIKIRCSTGYNILQTCATAPETESWRICRSIRTDDSLIRSTAEKLDPGKNRHPVESLCWTCVCVSDTGDVRNVTEVDPVICTIRRNSSIDLESELVFKWYNVFEFSLKQIMLPTLPELYWLISCWIKFLLKICQRLGKDFTKFW